MTENMQEAGIQKAIRLLDSFDESKKVSGAEILYDLYMKGNVNAGVALAFVHLENPNAPQIDLMEKVKLLVDEVRRNLSSEAALEIYYYYGNLVEPDTLRELLELVRKNSITADSILSKLENGTA